MADKQQSLSSLSTSFLVMGLGNLLFFTVSSLYVIIQSDWKVSIYGQYVVFPFVTGLAAFIIVGLIKGKEESDKNVLQIHSKLNSRLGHPIRFFDAFLWAFLLVMFGYLIFSISIHSFSTKLAAINELFSLFAGIDIAKYFYWRKRESQDL